MKSDAQIVNSFLDNMEVADRNDIIIRVYPDEFTIEKRGTSSVIRVKNVDEIDAYLVGYAAALGKEWDDI